MAPEYGDTTANEALSEQHSHSIYQPDDDYISEVSMSTSDEVELDHLNPDVARSDDEEAGLTTKERSRRKRRRRRSMDSDARILGNSHASQLGQKTADRTVIRELFLNSLLVGSWYLFSLSISIYNKWMFTPKYLDFHFPLFTTSLHMLVQLGLATLVLYFVPHLRPSENGSDETHGHAPARRDSTPPEKSVMTRSFYLTRIAPCGAATGLDIGLGNMSLKFITLTFYTMCKSSSLAFVLTFAFIFRLENPSVKLITVIVAMTIGVIMMVAGEVDFDALGFALVILAAFFSGFRWSLTQILLLRSPATSNPFSSIFFLAPIMFFSLALIAIPVEGPLDLVKGLTDLVDAKGIFLGISILLFPGLLAFLMTASEFALLQRTSVVTLSICGIFKEVVTISAAGIVFHDPLTPINISGLLITIASIAAYNYLKITKMRETARLEVADTRKGVGENELEADLDAAEPMLRTPSERHRSISTVRASSERSRSSNRVVSSKDPRVVD
ncbi:uncharacterized protein KY384_002506 [Bacidia gigantensis]|uniref:uncharacterized protein n=1 Tax=Bacidia gigantensis TaxID=2732470 RepID=UPI001D04F695|nr:uncharacterized protein KY384_002506 [Bacidia gigantensis]KAG8532629.1 hypothetical protein KY384_002506 [Bacidia gigantensis]